MEPTTPETAASSSTRSGGSRLRAGIVAAGAAFGLTLAGLGIAAAQTDGSTPDPTVEPAPQPAPEGGAQEAPGPDGPDGVRRHRGPGHKGMGMGIHGEFTTRAPGGGFQTLATQHGDVTAVSASSLTVKSEDGFSRTYVVNDDTIVNAGDEGIADVEVGDKVHVVAVVKDGTASAVQVHDGTQIRASHEKWQPRHQRPAPPAGATTPTTTA